MPKKFLQKLYALPEILGNTSVDFGIVENKNIMRNKGGLINNKGIVKKSRKGKLLVSIITPVFNGNSYLEQTIQSVLGQTYENIEYIVIDGGSTDGSLEIIKKYEDKLDYWISEKDSGMYGAINKGLKIASGDILAYLNSDDLYFPNSVESAADYFNRHPSTELIYGNCEFIGPKNEFLYTYRYPKFRWKSFVSLNTNTIPQPTTFWRRAIHKKIDYFDATLKMCGDFDFYAKVGKCCRIVHINRVLSRFRIHNTSLTILQEHRNKDEIKVIHERYINFSKIQQKVLSWCFTIQFKLLNLSLMFEKAYRCFRFAKLSRNL